LLAQAENVLPSAGAYPLTADQSNDLFAQVMRFSIVGPRGSSLGWILNGGLTVPEDRADRIASEPNDVGAEQAGDSASCAHVTPRVTGMSPVLVPLCAILSHYSLIWHTVDREE
jgi:hypothetical protein